MTLTVTTFNIVISADLPRVGYFTLLDVFVLIGLFFTAIGVVEFAVLSFLRSSWLATNLPKPAKYRALAVAIEQFFRVAMLPMWLTIAILFFTGDTVRQVAIPIIVVLIVALAVWRAVLSYRSSLKRIEAERVRAEQDAANKRDTLANAVVVNDAQQLMCPCCAAHADKPANKKVKRRVKREDGAE